MLYQILGYLYRLSGDDYTIKKKWWQKILRHAMQPLYYLCWGQLAEIEENIKNDQK